VDWRPWGPEAFAEARERGVPVLLSSGYNACHWCHVMAAESFSDPVLARFLDEHFVAIKVDKEERPEVDAFYMDAVVRMTGRGWLAAPRGPAPRRPPVPGGALPPAASAVRSPVVPPVARRGVVDVGARSRASRTRASGGDRARRGDLGATLDAIVSAYRFDVGGWGEGPRFPQAPRLELLLAAPDREDARRAVIHLLDTLDASGVHDHLGGGFHRYAVEEDWVVPHFEKLLVDNAQLAGLYLRAHAALGVERYRTVARRTLGYLLELRTDAGTFAASESAIDPNGEGAFYTWTPSELRAVLGDERGALAARAFAVGEWGNHEGRSVLVRKGDPSVVAAIRGPLRAARGRRPRPERDDKCVVAWNALAIEALVRGGDLLGEPALTAAALGAAARIASLQGTDGALPRSPGGAPGILDDYAAWTLACLRLHASTGAGTGWSAHARRGSRSSSGSCPAVHWWRRRRAQGCRRTASPSSTVPIRRAWVWRSVRSRHSRRSVPKGSRESTRSSIAPSRARGRASGRSADHRPRRGDWPTDRRRVDRRTAPSRCAGPRSRRRLRRHRSRAAFLRLRGTRRRPRLRVPWARCLLPTDEPGKIADLLRGIPG
jgi:uncharacterized protein YyaL (SSP411 family)